MACRGCSSSDGCGCSVIGGEGVTVSGTGTPVTGPYIVSVDFEEVLDGVAENDTACSDLDDPRVLTKEGDGTLSFTPLPCNSILDTPVPGQAFAFTWDTATSFTAPPDGGVKFNNASPASTTTIYVGDQDVHGTDITAWLAALDDTDGYPRGMIKVYSRTDLTAWASFKLTAYAAGPPGLYQLIVTYVDHSGTFDDSLVGDTVLDFSVASEGSIGGFNSIQTIVTLTGAYTFVAGDEGTYFRCDTGPYSLTVPAEADEYFNDGSHIDVIAIDTDIISIVGDVGVTVNASPGYDLNGQWASATLIKVGTDEWDLVGNLSA